MDDIQTVADYIDIVLDGFSGDPADSEYQQGYEAAIVEMKEYLQERGVLP